MKKQMRARWTMKQVQELSAAKGSPFAKDEKELKEWTTGYRGDTITVTQKPADGQMVLARFTFDPSTGGFTEIEPKRVLGSRPKATAKPVAKSKGSRKKAAGKKPAKRKK